ncbi:MAG: peptidoglycan DD-metalloendopeptidase family protein [Fibrobacteria bacterium]|nr:peptidoglycan DD-metalloendopeptidase family protein [Fibrobacteria bacterium]
MRPSERIKFLVLRESSGESWAIHVPLRFFHFLVVATMSVVILAGFAVTWLGAITVRLQTADALARENAELREDLRRMDQLQEELQTLEIQHRRVLSLTQAFLDDSVDQASLPVSSMSGLYDDQARNRVLQAFANWLERRRLTRQSAETPDRPELLVPPVEVWSVLKDIDLGTGNLAERLILVEPSSPVRSPVNGIVMTSGWDPIRGLETEIASAGGFSVHLGHMGTLDVSPGDFVQQGQRIGRTSAGSGVEPARMSVKVMLDGLAIDPLIAMMR